MPFKLPKLCDSCLHYYTRNNVHSPVERCVAFPGGIPMEIVDLGGVHFHGEVQWELMEGEEDAFSTWLGFWYVGDDDGGLGDGVTGIFPVELGPEPT